MYKICETVRASLDATAILNCELFTDEERLSLISELRDSYVADIPGIPTHTKILRDALTRRIERELIAAQAKSRKTQGKQEPTEVDARPATEDAEAGTGQAEGLEEQAEDAGGVPDKGHQGPRGPRGKGKAKA